MIKKSLKYTFFKEEKSPQKSSSSIILWAVSCVEDMPTGKLTIVRRTQRSRVASLPAGRQVQNPMQAPLA